LIALGRDVIAAFVSLEGEAITFGVDMDGVSFLKVTIEQLETEFV